MKVKNALSNFISFNYVFYLKTVCEVTSDKDKLINNNLGYQYFLTDNLSSGDDSERRSHSARNTPFVNLDSSG